MGNNISKSYRTANSLLTKVILWCCKTLCLQRRLADRVQSDLVRLRTYIIARVYYYEPFSNNSKYLQIIKRYCISYPRKHESRTENRKIFDRSNLFENDSKIFSAVKARQCSIKRVISTSDVSKRICSKLFCSRHVVSAVFVIYLVALKHLIAYY